SFFYFTDDGDLAALRYRPWKFVFLEQRCPGTLRVWAEPFTVLRVPKIFNLRTDPFERADVTSNTYYDWLIDRAFLAIPAQAGVKKFLETFKEFPRGRRPPALPSMRRWKTWKTGTGRQALAREAAERIGTDEQPRR